jgi:hypothetical protein
MPRQPHFGGHLVDIPLPASIDDDGLMMVDYLTTEDDRDRLLCGGRVRLWLYMHGALRPIVLETMDPEITVRES